MKDMAGLVKRDGKYIFTVVDRGEELKLCLFRGEKKVSEIPFDPGKRTGDVWTLETDRDIKDLSYCYESDGHVYTDPSGTVFSGRRKFGSLKDGTRVLKTPVGEAVEGLEETEEWKADKALDIPYSESIIYRLHVRGFTKQANSGIVPEARGTFKGVTEKIPYLKELGINAVELMPPYEFNEVMLPAMGNDDPFKKAATPTGKINYWGFTNDAMMLAPKASFTSAGSNPRNEFREMVLELHRNGIEVIIDLYFSEDTLPDYMCEAVRYWRVNYHVDGVHIIGNVQMTILQKDPYLSRFKLWADGWDVSTQKSMLRGRADCPRRYLANYNNAFQDDMRRVLKGDEGMITSLMQRVRDNPSNTAVINYMANAGGMSLMDTFSYDRKHNEDNGERNRDGTDSNFSWNCGEEGKTRKPSVKKLRIRMIKNAYLLLFLSQGTPLINSGDEFGMTRLGNNNAYCWDNSINWTDWSLKEKTGLFEFLKNVISFRKKHGVFHQERELKGIDYKSTGIPDISFHGETAWMPETENYRRQLGIMYSGAYGNDSSFLVLYNFHWEKHSFLLPHPPVGMLWKDVIYTGREGDEFLLSQETEKQEKERKKTENKAEDQGNADYRENALNERELLPRSIMVIEAVKDENYRPKKKARRKLK